MQLEALDKRQEIRTVGTAEVQQAPPLPPLCQRFQFLAEYRPVPKIVPAGGYPIEGLRIYLTPCIPSPLKGKFMKRDVASLTLLSIYPLRERWLYPESRLLV
jgi:hypothetical protein